MNCVFTVGWNIADLVQCTIMGLGIPMDLLSLGILAAFTLFALWARIDYNISLGLAAALAVALLMINPGNQFLIIIVGLIALAIGLRILIGFIAMLRQ